MFKTIKAKLEERNLRKEKDYLNQKLADTKYELSVYETLLEDININYLPVRNKCENLIRQKALNRYPLKDVLEITALADYKFEFKIYDIKEDYWDGHECIVRGGLLFDKTIQLYALKFILDNEDPLYGESEYGRIIDSMTILEDKYKGLDNNVKLLKENLEALELQINNLERTK